MGIDDSVSDAFAEIQRDIVKYILFYNKSEEEYDDLKTMIDNDLKWNQLRIDVEEYAYELFNLISKKIKK